jgi:hypothetical protein
LPRQILDGAIMGKQSLIGARELLTQGTKIPPCSLVLGAPAKVVRKLSNEERAGPKWWAQKDAPAVPRGSFWDLPAPARFRDTGHPFLLPFMKPQVEIHDTTLRDGSLV